MKIRVRCLHLGLSLRTTKECNSFSRDVEKYSAEYQRCEHHKPGLHDKRCQIEARPTGRRPLSVSIETATIEAAVQGAANKMERLRSTRFGRSLGGRPSNRKATHWGLIQSLHRETLSLLRSIELNLNPAGNGDMDADAVSRLDVVLGCFHSALRKKEDQTERYLAALRNPTLQILGHPRGRIYNFRLGLSCDWRRVFDLAADLDKAVEIDAYPDRQDLSGDLVRLAAKAGCRISIGTDSHGPSQLRFIEFGLASALSAGIERDRILNFMNAEELLRWVTSVRDHEASRVPAA
jgi:histidinol phosphatase-like PHP family hydrolase